jgi:hypothetical protein
MKQFKCLFFTGASVVSLHPSALIFKGVTPTKAGIFPAEVLS